MSYRCGIMGSEPVLICDGCGLMRPVMSERSVRPCKWFLDRKPAPGWTMEKREDGTRARDWCGACSAKKGRER